MPTDIAFIGTDNAMQVDEAAGDLVQKMGQPGFVQVHVLLANGGKRQQYACLLHAYTIVDR